MKQTAFSKSLTKQPIAHGRSSCAVLLPDINFLPLEFLRAKFLYGGAVLWSVGRAKYSVSTRRRRVPYLLIRQDLWPFVKFMVEKVMTAVGVTRIVSVLMVIFRLARWVVDDTLLNLQRMVSFFDKLSRSVQSIVDKVSIHETVKEERAVLCR